jgi:hypothetical protein
MEFNGNHQYSIQSDMNPPQTPYNGQQSNSTKGQPSIHTNQLIV